MYHYFKRYPIITTTFMNLQDNLLELTHTIISNKVNMLSPKIYVSSLKDYISLGRFVTLKSNDSIIHQLLEVNSKGTN